MQDVEAVEGSLWATPSVRSHAPSPTSRLMRGPEGQSASRVVEALYALAADPAGWVDMIDLLEQAPPAEARAEDFAQLAYGAERVAQMARQAASPPGAERPSLGEVGVLVVSRSGQLIVANPLGRLSAERLGFAPSAHGWRLVNLANFEVIDEARRRGVGTADSPVMVKFLEETGDGESFAYVIRAEALPPSLAATLESDLPPERGAVAVLLPAATGSESFWSGIRASFGLTPAEVRLTARLRDGMTLKEAAADLAISPNTARNQLASIFDKLGIRRQSELIRSLSQLSTLFGAMPGRADDPLHRGGPAIFATEADAALHSPALQTQALPRGGVLAYREYGLADGRPVLVCHGGLGASLLPRGTDELCRELGLRLLCPERPGIGRSPPRTPYSLSAVAVDLAAFVAHLAPGPVQVCTLTSGARFGLAAANAFREPPQRVLLLSPRLRPRPEAGEASPSPMVRFQAWISHNLWVTGSLMAVMRLRLSRPLMERITRASATAPGDLAFLRAHPSVIDMLYEGLQEAWVTSSRGTADEIAALRTEPDPGPTSFAAPVEIWHGAEDTYASAEALAAYYQVPAGQVRILPAIGNYMITRHWGEVLMSLAEPPPPLRP